MANIRIATRESRLALVQANLVADALRLQNPDITVSLVPMTTTGDQMKDLSLSKAGGKGLFLKELETALLNGDAEIAVHSMKDVPVELPEGLVIDAILSRADPHDVLVAPESITLDGLPVAARVGTSSLRRQAQLRAARPDIDVIPLRGNVDTRLQKLSDGEYDAIVLAKAGVERLGITGVAITSINTAICLPAVGQGAIGIECRADDTPTRALIKGLEDEETRHCVDAERAVARALGADCASPVAIYCVQENDVLDIQALVATPDGKRLERRQVTSGGSPEETGMALARELLAAGAVEILAAQREST